MRRLLHKIIYLPIYLLSFFCPRFERRISIGCYKNLFLDNSKYFFLELANDPEFDVGWITNSRDVYDEISRLGKKVYFRHSLSGIFFTLTSKYFVYSSYVSDVHEFTFKGAKLINLWHGFPIKHIEYDIKEGPLANIFSHKIFYKGYFSNFFFVYQKSHLMFARSEREAKIFENAFLIPRSSIYLAIPQRLYGLSNAEPSKVLIAPTWSDSGDNTAIVKSITSLDNFCDEMVNKPSVLFKQHPNDNFDYTALDLKNIEILPKYSDIYQILPSIAFLISDFSSLVLDFIALDRGYGLISGALNSRGTYFSNDEFKGRQFPSMEIALTAYLDDSLAEMCKNGLKCETEISMADAFKAWLNEVPQ